MKLFLEICHLRSGRAVLLLLSYILTCTPYLEHVTAHPLCLCLQIEYLANYQHCIEGLSSSLVEKFDADGESTHQFRDYRDLFAQMPLWERNLQSIRQEGIKCPL